MNALSLLFCLSLSLSLFFIFDISPVGSIQHSPIESLTITTTLLDLMNCILKLTCSIALGCPTVGISLSSTQLIQFTLIFFQLFKYYYFFIVLCILLVTSSREQLSSVLPLIHLIFAIVVSKCIGLVSVFILFTIRNLLLLISIEVTNFVT